MNLIYFILVFFKKNIKKINTLKKKKLHVNSAILALFTYSTV